MILASGEYFIKHKDKEKPIGPIQIEQFEPSIYQKANRRDLDAYVEGYLERLVHETGRDIFVSLTFTFLEETGYKTLDGSPVYYGKKEPITIKRVKEWRQE